MKTNGTKGDNMKPLKFALTAGIALAMAFSAQAAEKGSARGGAGDLLQSPSNDMCCEAARAVVMVCSNCQSEWLVKTDLSARGATKPTYFAEKHLCGKCRTELKLTGQGKYATNIPTHLCAACK